jgi:hypothetical protein
MTTAPDLAGFAAAQRQLARDLGVDAVFTIPPGEPVWPPGTALDPDTGRPYDPFLEPESQDEETHVTVRCTYASRPLVSMDPAATPIGSIDAGSAALIMDADLYPPVASARRVVVGQETYSIDLARHDELAGYDRMILYLEHA